MTREEIDSVVSQLEDLQARIANLHSLMLMRRDAPKPEPERLLTVEEAAKRIGVRREWIYRRSGELPFVVKLSEKSYRISERKLGIWLKAR